MYLIGHLTLVLTDSTRLIYRLWWTPDWISDWAHTLLFAIHIIVYLLIHAVSYSNLYYYYMFTFICMCIFPFYSHTFTRSSDSLGLHIQICDYLLLIRFLERSAGILRSQSSLLFDQLFLIISVSSLFHRFHDSMHWTHTVSYTHLTLPTIYSV